MNDEQNSKVILLIRKTNSISLSGHVILFKESKCHYIYILNNNANSWGFVNLISGVASNMIQKIISDCFKDSISY